MKLIISTKTLIYCALLGLVVFVAGVVLGFRIFPNLITQKIWESSIIVENTTQWDMFKKIPFPFQFKVYFFDVQNVPEIMQGEKPVLKEIGPYVYKLYRWKDGFSWNQDDVSFYDYMRFEFDTKASEPLSDNDPVTILNSPYNALLLTIEELSPAMLESIDGALPLIFNKYNGLFMTDKVKNILFEGQILCENGAEEELVAKLVCQQFRAKAAVSKGMKLIGKSINYSYLDFKNNTHQGRFTIKSGQKVREDVNKLIKFENKSRIAVWGAGTTPCNQIKGAVMFRPFLTKNMTFNLFAEDVCRGLTMKFKKTEEVKGIEGFRYGVLNNSFSQAKPESDDGCFCIKKSKTMSGDVGCLKDGLLDLTNCVGAPVLMSFPHLLYGDPEYISSVVGMKPIEKLHDTYVILEPMTGAPLKMAKRVQFNMFIRPIPDIIDIENVTKALVPIFWLEESVTLEDEYIEMMNKMLFNNLKILFIVKWAIIGLGGVVVIVCTGLLIYQ